MWTKRWFAPLIVLAFVLLFLLQMPAAIGLAPALQESLRFSVVFLLVATVPYLLLVWATLRAFDILAGIAFKGSAYDKLQQDPRALARYLGARINAVCIGLAIVVGFVLSSVRL